MLAIPVIRTVRGPAIIRPVLVRNLPRAYLQPAAEHAFREGALSRSEDRLEVEPLRVAKGLTHIGHT